MIVIDSGNSCRGSDRISTKEMNKSLKESDRLDDPNLIHLAQPSYLEEVNNELTTKYNKQREFVSLAAHELRSPILPILGIFRVNRN
jgi:signal transduction histidine kinase